MQYSFMIVFYDCISWCQLFFLLFHFLFCLFGWWSPPYQEVGPDLRGWGRSLRKLGFFLAWWQFLSWLGACPQLWGLDLYLWSGSGSLPCSEIKLHFWSLCPNRCRALAWSGSVPFLAYSCTGWQCSPNWLASLLPQGVCVCVCVCVQTQKDLCSGQRIERWCRRGWNRNLLCTDMHARVVLAVYPEHQEVFNLLPMCWDWEHALFKSRVIVS